jgi:DNA-binding MarR family transcriptional regulator
MNEINNELYEKFSHLQLLRHKQHLHSHAKGLPLADPSRGQGRILAILKMQDGISTKDLSYLLGIRVSSLNELLAKMEKNGYISREASEADKRVMLVKLTEKGKNEEQQDWNPGDIFACLTEEEKKTLAAYLDRIIANIETELGVDTDDDERDWWTHGGRERMGDELLEHMAYMRRGGFEARGGAECHQFGGHPGHGGFPRGGHMDKASKEPREPEEE